MNKEKTVKFSLDPNNPPPLTEKQLQQALKIAAMSDSEIDFSDAPEMLDAFWVRVGQTLPEQKKQITLSVDADVIDFSSNQEYAIELA